MSRDRHIPHPADIGDPAQSAGRADDRVPFGDKTRSKRICPSKIGRRLLQASSRLERACESSTRALRGSTTFCKWAAVIGTRREPGNAGRVDGDVLHHLLLEAQLDGLPPAARRIAKHVILRHWAARRHRAIARRRALPGIRSEKNADIGVRLKRILPVRDRGLELEIADMRAQPADAVKGVHVGCSHGQIPALRPRRQIPRLLRPRLFWLGGFLFRGRGLSAHGLFRLGGLGVLGSRFRRLRGRVGGWRLLRVLLLGGLRRLFFFGRRAIRAFNGSPAAFPFGMSEDRAKNRPREPTKGETRPRNVPARREATDALPLTGFFLSKPELVTLTAGRGGFRQLCVTKLRKGLRAPSPSKQSQFASIE